ncbi:AAA family ATPase [Frankia sp. CiP3]|uniref:AAA family ATPase n=1 Tax=Frankia sp. CiP3 TaxID=2880971 RepID=UPI001EF69337|nr:LuxR family transcriptional regulator [Frankia sp. CiP3]
MSLFERDKPLSDLAALYDECRRGQERIALISGAAGTGKTEIIRTFTEDALVADAIHCVAIASAVDHALPFGTIWQLFMSPQLPTKAREQADRLLNFEALAAKSGTPGQNEMNTEKYLAYLSHILSRLLLDVTEETNRPLLMVVDDAHNADQESLQCLSSIIDRLRQARFMVMVSATDGPQSFSPAFLGGLPPAPHCRHIHLDLLTENGVESTLVEQICGTVAKQVAAEFHAISGGNPTMVRGLVDDYFRSGQGTEPGRRAIGPETIRAFRSILHRRDSAMLELAQWLAILGDSGTPSAAGILAGLDSDSTVRALNALDNTGCFASGRFRHPALHNAVLDGLTPCAQAAMHARAADLLRIEGASLRVVADHLVAAGKPQATWAVSALNEAAEHALSSGEVRRALSYLRLARRLPAQAPHSDHTKALLARAEWRLNPALTMRHGAEVISTILSGGDPSGQDLPAWVSRLMWFGREDDARETLKRISDPKKEIDQHTADRLDAIRLGLSYMFPSGEEPERRATALARGQSAPASNNPMRQAVALLVRTLTDGPGEPTVAAEQLIEQSTLSEPAFGAVASALGALVYGERLGTADTWCQTFQRDAAAQEAPVWQAVFAALRSMIALRQGDLVSAETHAGRALQLIPAEGWGIGILIPLSVLVNTATMMGRHKKALTHLRTPVPDVLLKTPIGIHYLQARGRFYLARKNFPSALNEFQLVSDLVTRWNLDLPALVPWRTDAALVHLGLRRREQAHQLALEQLKMLTLAHTRERGISLRVLAASGDPAKRRAHLRQSVQELQHSGDRLELARALADLGREYHASGETGRARDIRSRAHRIAKQCGATVITDTSFPAEDTGSRAGEDKKHDAGAHERYRTLSKREQRVAALAADGYSNREIARQLFITTSTVEQHLTRVYSKLNISCRSDLPVPAHGS